MEQQKNKREKNINSEEIRISQDSFLPRSLKEMTDGYQKIARDPTKNEQEKLEAAHKHVLFLFLDRKKALTKDEAKEILQNTLINFNEEMFDRAWDTLRIFTNQDNEKNISNPIVETKKIEGEILPVIDTGINNAFEINLSDTDDNDETITNFIESNKNIIKLPDGDLAIRDKIKQKIVNYKEYLAEGNKSEKTKYKTKVLELLLKNGQVEKEEAKRFLETLLIGGVDNDVFEKVWSVMTSYITKESILTSAVNNNPESIVKEIKNSSDPKQEEIIDDLERLVDTAAWLEMSGDLQDFLNDLATENVDPLWLERKQNEHPVTENPSLDPEDGPLPEPSPEVVEKFDKLPEIEKSAIIKGLLNLGFGAKRLKSNLMAGAVGLSYSTYKKLNKTDQNKDIKDQGAVERFLYQAKESYVTDSKEAQARIDQIDSTGRALLGLVHPLSIAIKGSRVVYDLTTGTFNPLRYIMMGSMIASRTTGIAKDARLLNRDISKKSGHLENPKEQISQAEKEINRIKTITDYLREQVTEASEDDKPNRRKKLDDFIREKGTRLALLQDKIDNLKNNPESNTLSHEEVRDKFLTNNDKEGLAKKRDLARQIVKRNRRAQSLFEHYEKIGSNRQTATEAFTTKESNQKDRLIKEGKTEMEIEKILSGDNIITTTREFMKDSFQKLINLDAEFSISKLNKKITKLEKNDGLSSEERDQEVQKVIAKYSKHLKELDQMTSRYGTVDTLSYLLSMVEKGSKKAVTVMAIESLLMPFYDKIIDFMTPEAGDIDFETTMTGPLKKIVNKEDIHNQAEKIFNDTFKPYIESHSKVKDFLSLNQNDFTPPVQVETIHKPILSLLENTGAEVTTENGITKVVYEIGQGKDFSALDQALRRVVAQEFSFGDDRVLSNVEAAQMENVLANVRELLQGHSVAGMSPADIKTLAHFDNGQLQITNYEQFKTKILDKLTDRAEKNINSDSPAVKFAQATSKKVWEEILDKKNSGDVQVDPHFFDQAKTIAKTTTDHLGKTISNHSLESIHIPTPSAINREDIDHLLEPLKDRAMDYKIDIYHTVADISNHYDIPEDKSSKLVEMAHNLGLGGVSKDGSLLRGGSLDKLAQIFSGPNLDYLTDIKGELDPDQIRIFKEIIPLSGDSNMIRQILNITRSIDWEPAKEIALAKSLLLTNPFNERVEQLKQLQIAFGDKLISDNTLLTFKGTSITLSKVAHNTGNIDMDFSKKSIMLSTLENGRGKINFFPFRSDSNLDNAIKKLSGYISNLSQSSRLAA